MTHYDDHIAQLLEERRKRQQVKQPVVEPIDRLPSTPDREERLAQIREEQAANGNGKAATPTRPKPPRQKGQTKTKKNWKPNTQEPEPFLHIDFKGPVLVTKAATAYGGVKNGVWQQYETPDGTPKWNFRIQTRAIGYHGKTRTAEAIVNIASPEKPDFAVGDYIYLDEPQAPVTRRITAHGWELGNEQ